MDGVLRRLAEERGVRRAPEQTGRFDEEGRLVRRDNFATDSRTIVDFLRRNGVTAATQPTTADAAGYTVVVECMG